LREGVGRGSKQTEVGDRFGDLSRADQVLIREASLSAIDKACMKEHYSKKTVLLLTQCL